MKTLIVLFLVSIGLSFAGEEDMGHNSKRPASNTGGVHSIHVDSLLLESLSFIHSSLYRGDLEDFRQGAKGITVLLAEDLDSSKAGSQEESRKIATGMASIKSLSEARILLASFVESMLAVLEKRDEKDGFFLFQCPMALQGTGARWIQKSNEAENPYFGAGGDHRCEALLQAL